MSPPHGSPPRSPEGAQRHRVQRPPAGWSVDALGVVVMEWLGTDGAPGVGITPAPGATVSLLPEGRLCRVAGAPVRCAADVDSELATLQSARNDAAVFDVRAVVKVFDVGIGAGAPKLGIEWEERLLGGLEGAWVHIAGVVPGGAAADAGLLPGHYITAVDDTPIHRWSDVAGIIACAAARGESHAAFELELRPWELWQSEDSDSDGAASVASGPLRAEWAVVAKGVEGAPWDGAVAPGGGRAARAAAPEEEEPRWRRMKKKMSLLLSALPPVGDIFLPPQHRASPRRASPLARAATARAPLRCAPPVVAPPGFAESFCQQAPITVAALTAAGRPRGPPPRPLSPALPLSPASAPTPHGDADAPIFAMR